MKKNYLWKLYGLVACLMLSLFVVSCQKEKDEEELRREVIVNAEQVMDKVGSIFKSSETIETMAAHLGEIKAMANVEDAWQEGDAICVKIKNGGVIMWSYYQEVNSTVDTTILDPLIDRLQWALPLSKDGAICSEKSICILNAFDDSFEPNKTLLYNIIRRELYNLGWKTSIIERSKVTPHFIVNNISKYGMTIIGTHGGYFDRRHWLLTGMPWKEMKKSGEWDIWKEDNVRLNYVKRSDLLNAYVLISETYFQDYLLDNFPNNSIMFLDACSTLEDNDNLWQILRNKGLGCMVGYTKSIYSNGANSCLAAFIDALSCSSTTGEACRIANTYMPLIERIQFGLELKCCPENSDIIIVESPDDPDDEPGLFSVSPTKKVFFSPGNLQYQASTNTWRFAEHQYDYVGADNSNICATYSGWIDLFGWGTGNNPTLSSTNDTDYGTFVDWGTNAISNGGNTANQWRTLTSAEWEYLFNNHQYGIGNVNGVGGVILLPDSWTQPSGCSFTAEPASNNGDWTHNSYTLAQWANMEAAGAVFLPAAGVRDGTNVFGMGSNGVYWSSTPNSESYANLLDFRSDYLYAMTYGLRHYGFSVRLVRDRE